MEKYGVVTKQDLTKLASAECPNCGSKIQNHGGTPVCPKCGTAPFEDEKKHVKS